MKDDYLCSFSLASPKWLRYGDLVSNAINVFYVTEQGNVAMLKLANSVEQKEQISRIKTAGSEDLNSSP